MDAIHQLPRRTLRRLAGRSGPAEDAALAAIVRSSQDAVIAQALDGTITAWNPGATAIYGYPAEAALGRNIEIMFPVDSLDEERIRQAQVASGQADSGFRCRRLCSDGGAITVVMSMSSVRNSNGSVVGMASISRAMSDREEAESHVLEAVRLSESRLRQLTENVDTVFILRQLDPPAFLYISPSVKRVTGFSADELIDRPSSLFDMGDAQDLAKIDEYRATVVAGLPARMELHFVHPDGEIRWVRVSDTPVPNPHGLPERAVTAMEDITERTQVAAALSEAESVARAANEAKSMFLSRMSHELRTPLNAVLGFGQLLERNLDDEDNLMFTRHILRAGRHLLQLIDEVLDITRIESGEMTVSLEPVDAAGLIDETVDLMRPLADDVHVTVTVSHPDHCSYLLADRQRLRQVLLNLLSNAIKYNHRGGNVWVSHELVDQHMVITLRDDGRGIAPGLRSRLFTPFDRLDAEITGVEGTGVGLAVTRSLMMLMNGSITFASPGEGGSSFSVALPRAMDGGSACVPATGDEQRKTLGGPERSSEATLLYIEDNDPNIQVIESLMRLRPGWRMLHAGLGRLGLELAAAHRPDLVLLDLHLPDLSGFDVLAALKGSSDTADLPVVVLSADASMGQKDRLLQAGAADYLSKPVDLALVLTVLDAVAKPNAPAPARDNSMSG